MDKAASHPKTKEQLVSFVQNPSHALCLVGPPGAGKNFLAEVIAQELLGNVTEDAIYRISPEGASISIEQIRALYKFLKLRKPGSNALRRAIIIENAQTMGTEAQNALLKTLEEPPEDAIFILTTDGSSGLRSTIRSRTQTIRILPLSLDQARAYFKESGLAKAYHLSGGYAGLLHALLNDEDHELVAAVLQAKTLIQASPFERLLLVDSLAKQKESLPTLFYAMQRVMGALLSTATDSTKLKRLTASMRAIYQAELDAARSANTKLLLTDLFLHL